MISQNVIVAFDFFLFINNIFTNDKKEFSTIFHGRMKHSLNLDTSCPFFISIESIISQKLYAVVNLFDFVVECIPAIGRPDCYERG